MNNNSFSVLVRMATLGAMAILIALWKRDFIDQVYFSNQISNVGQVFNTVILLLFLLGLAKLAKLLMGYMFEERQVAKFQKAMEADEEFPEKKVSDKSIIARRYQMIRSLDSRGVAVNHSALAATLVADESTRSSFPRFINNSMILMGVFGTIIALSIALVGASDLLGQNSSGGSMGTVIHGMSTALSTTMTAIFCYLFYGYFYLKFNDVQTRLFSSVEQLTTLHILPCYSRSADTLVDDVAGLVGSLEKTAFLMQNMQGEMLSATRELRTVIESVQQQTAPLTDDIKVIKKVLREGFRLGGDE
jgi:biopolymer transport protein ExbB/TolQ